MKILVLASDLPATSRMPGSPRLFSFCSELSRRHELHLVTLSGSGERYRLFQEEMVSNPVYKSVTILPTAPPPTWWNKQVHRMRLAPGATTKYMTPHYHRHVRSAVQNLLRRNRIDLAYVDGLRMTQYVEATPDRPAIADVHDSGTLLFRRMARLEKHPVRKILLHLEASGEARWERTLGDLFSLVITNSNVDEEVIRRLSPSARTLTIGNGVDSEFFTPTGGVDNHPARLIFTGVMNYGPNADATAHFGEVTFPLIRAACPEAEFWVVGTEPTAEVQALAQLPGVHVTGGVEDVRPYLESAGVFVCPLRYGSGVKNKILAALCMGKPVVATRLSLEGLELREQRDILVADEPTDFAQKVLSLVKNPAGAEILGQSGQAFVRERYSWKAKATQLDDALRSLTLRPGLWAGG